MLKDNDSRIVLGGEFKLESLPSFLTEIEGFPVEDIHYLSSFSRLRKLGISGPFWVTSVSGTIPTSVIELEVTGHAQLTILSNMQSLKCSHGTFSKNTQYLITLQALSNVPTSLTSLYIHGKFYGELNLSSFQKLQSLVISADPQISIPSDFLKPLTNLAQLSFCNVTVTLKHINSLPTSITSLRIENGTKTSNLC